MYLVKNNFPSVSSLFNLYIYVVILTNCLDQKLHITSIYVYIRTICPLFYTEQYDLRTNCTQRAFICALGQNNLPWKSAAHNVHLFWYQYQSMLPQKKTCTLFICIYQQGSICPGNKLHTTCIYICINADQSTLGQNYRIRWCVTGFIYFRQCLFILAEREDIRISQPTRIVSCFYFALIIDSTLQTKTWSYPHGNCIICKW